MLTPKIRETKCAAVIRGECFAWREPFVPPRHGDPMGAHDLKGTDNRQRDQRRAQNSAESFTPIHSGCWSATAGQFRGLRALFSDPAVVALVMPDAAAVIHISRQREEREVLPIHIVL